MTIDATEPGQPVPDEVLEQHIHSINIPPRPSILARVQAEMAADEPDFRALEKLISADVALAGGLVKTVNSPYFGLNRRATTVHEALMLLGLASTCRAVAVFCLRGAFPDAGHFERFWDASAKVAALSGWLTKRLGSLKLGADEAYTFGLFRDCGIVILLQRFPTYLATLKAANGESTLSFTEVERQHLPTDHTVIGRLLVQNWWLPDDLCEAIRHHHDSGYLAGPDTVLNRRTRQMIAVAQLAEYLLQRATGGAQTCEWAKLGPACMGVLDLGADHLVALQAEARVQLGTMV
ncbi:MAG TPA: HDOD domain-containing protein [Burkholderiaceae bacterium]|nr:HDOD domain-containing protein [Burkholderiaceae bacterium]